MRFTIYDLRFTIARLVLAFAILCLPSSILAAELITATVSFTNAAGTTNGQTIAINASTRTWTNNVVIPASQILTNDSPEGSATNLYQHLGFSPVAGTSASYGSSTSVVVRGFPGSALTITLSDGYGAVAYATNTITSAVVLRLPVTVESGAQQTNLTTRLVDALNLTAPTNQLMQASPAFAQLVGTTNAQTISGIKTFTETNQFNGLVVTSRFEVRGSAGINNATLTNGVNRGNAFRSPGSGVQSEQIGLGATASGDTALAIGWGATASGIAGTIAIGGAAAATGDLDIAVGSNASASGGNSAALGNTSLASGQAALAVGNEASSQGIGATAVGGQSVAIADNSTALGSTATVASGHTNSVAIGSAATTTKRNQIMLGSAAHVVTIPGSAEHLVTTGTNSFSDIAFRRYAITSLANGNNAGVVVGTNTFVQVSGPSGAFTLNGFTGSPNRDGHVVKILNRTGQNMTIANDSGTEPVAANRIYTLTGADVGPSTGDCIATFIYSAADSRWILESYSP